MVKRLNTWRRLIALAAVAALLLLLVMSSMSMATTLKVTAAMGVVAVWGFALTMVRNATRRSAADYRGYRLSKRFNRTTPYFGNGPGMGKNYNGAMNSGEPPGVQLCEKRFTVSAVFRFRGARTSQFWRVVPARICSAVQKMLTRDRTFMRVQNCKAFVTSMIRSVRRAAGENFYSVRSSVLRSPISAMT